MNAGGGVPTLGIMQQARRISGATLVVALAFTAAACGGDDDDESAPTLCDDVETLQSSVTDLKNVDVVANGVSALETAVSDVTTNVQTVADAAQDEFSDEVDALQESIQTLGTAITNVVSGGTDAVSEAVTGVETAATNLVDAVESEQCD